MKICTKCKQEKELKDFYKAKENADGFENRCKECKATYHRKNAKKISLRKKRRYYTDKEYREKVLQARKEYRLKNLDKIREQCREWHKINKKRSVQVVAREKVSNELKANRLKKKCCEYCGIEKVEAHHEDYSKPLSVQWLCKDCHRELHKNKRTQQFISLTQT
jgi:hypothetical protein|tara:strand:- start:737 stop:1228 length:492 start_codon:yes stop_codon:yes gene_type:complete